MRKEQDTINEKRKEEGSEPKNVDQDKIRRKHLENLHEHMDEQMEKRQYRLKHAQEAGDTTTQWDLIAAATEEANIDYHQLKGREATKMRGRSKVVFQKKEKNSLEGADIEEDKAAWCFATKAGWYRQTAGQYNRLSNKLTSIARQRKVGAKNGSGQRTKR